VFDSIFLKRCVAGCIDYMIISAPFIILKMIFEISFPMLVVLCYIAILFKDFFFRSVGKRALNLKIVDRSNIEILRNFNLVLRNVTLFIWPVDLIFWIVKKDVRIGDVISNTKVVEA